MAMTISRASAHSSSVWEAVGELGRAVLAVLGLVAEDDGARCSDCVGERVAAYLASLVEERRAPALREADRGLADAAPVLAGGLAHLLEPGVLRQLPAASFSRRTGSPVASSRMSAKRR